MFDVTKVSQFPGHNTVHEPAFSSVQVPQYVSNFSTFLVHDILRTFLLHFTFNASILSFIDNEMACNSHPLYEESRDCI